MAKKLIKELVGGFNAYELTNLVSRNQLTSCSKLMKFSLFCRVV